MKSNTAETCAGGLAISHALQSPLSGSVLHPYAARVLADLSARYWWEREYLTAVEEVFLSLEPVLLDSPVYEAERILERITEPERIISFPVAWTDDRGQVQLNRAWRVQWSSVLGPYKGGTRFHASTTLDGLKLLAFEQTFKNSLTGLPLGSGKGGADFSTKGRSPREIMRFCQAYMNELYHHIGPDTDVPAGDIGVGGREIGYLFGHYKRLSHRFCGVFTGKARAWGGSALRPEATGFGVAYLAEEMLRTRGESLDGLRVAVSGFGNVAWGLVKKVGELGGRVITLSGPDGYIYDADGVSGEKIDYLLALRRSGEDRVQPYADKYSVPFVEGRRPWEVSCDIAFPCAIQNELNLEDAKRLVAGGCRYLVEGANMPTTTDAVLFLQQQGLVFVPGKAANAGGVAVSGLEMSQNGAREYWSAEEVDRRLHQIMASIFRKIAETADRFGMPGNYAAGANIHGFVKVADALFDQGV
jgi:glutamate dehydrogenase (NADP+)